MVVETSIFEETIIGLVLKLTLYVSGKYRWIFIKIDMRIFKENVFGILLKWMR
jgi:hypothetical protein